MSYNFFDSKEGIRNEKGWLSRILRVTRGHKGINYVFLGRETYHLLRLAPATMSLGISGHSLTLACLKECTDKVRKLLPAGKRNAFGHIISGRPSHGCPDSLFKGGKRNFSFY